MPAVLVSARRGGQVPLADQTGASRVVLVARDSSWIQVRSADRQLRSLGDPGAR